MEASSWTSSQASSILPFVKQEGKRMKRMILYLWLALAATTFGAPVRLAIVPVDQGLTPRIPL
jgi:hypothetical protein